MALPFHFDLDILCDKGETRYAQQHSSENHCPGRKPPHPALRPARQTQIVKRIMKAIQMAVEQILTFSVPQILEKSPVCGSIFDSERVSHVSFCTFAFLHPEVIRVGSLTFTCAPCVEMSWSSSVPSSVPLLLPAIGRVAMWATPKATASFTPAFPMVTSSGVFYFRFSLLLSTHHCRYLVFVSVPVSVRANGRSFSQHSASTLLNVGS